MTSPLPQGAARRFFHSAEKSFPQRGKIPQSFSTPWKIRRKFFHSMEKSPAASSRIRDPWARRPQDVAVEDFFRIWAGFHAITTGGFSDDGALRTTRARLASASGRPRRASAEKMPVGFRAAQIRKKSSSLSRHFHLATAAP